MPLTFEVIQQKTLPLLKKHGVVKAAVFGSVGRNEATPASDVDFLVDFAVGRSLLDLIALKRELEETLQGLVDVVTYRALHPFIKERVLAEQRPIL